MRFRQEKDCERPRDQPIMFNEWTIEEVHLRICANEEDDAGERDNPAGVGCHGRAIKQRTDDSYAYLKFFQV